MDKLGNNIGSIFGMIKSLSVLSSSSPRQGSDGQSNDDDSAEVEWHDCVCLEKYLA